MWTNDLLPWLPCALAGAVLGLFYFGGLWWTVRALVDARRSAFFQLGSLLFRTAVTLLGFYLVGGGDARRLIACLAGFVLARLFVARRVRRAPLPEPAGEAQHEART